ncbi:MAG: hypothetical protein ACK56I_01835, partial [bacterium]
MNKYVIFNIFFLITLFCSKGEAQEFEASVLHKYVFLKWKWPADQQPDHYEIERRNRGGSFGMLAMTFSGEL